MTQLSRTLLVTDISSNIYTNKQRLIKGDTVKQRFLNLNDSSLNITADLNINGGYLGIDVNGLVNISFIKSNTPSGKFLKDNGTWDVAGSIPVLTSTYIGVGSTGNTLGGTSNLTFDPTISAGNIQRLTISGIGPQIDMYGSSGSSRIETNLDMYLTLFAAGNFVFRPNAVETFRLTPGSKTIVKDSGRSIQLGGLLGSETLNSALYFADTPTNSNHSLAGNNLITYVNAANGVIIQNNNVNQLTIQSGTSVFNTHITTTAQSITAGIGVGISNAWFRAGASTSSKAQFILDNGVANATISAPVSGMINNDGTNLWIYLAGAWQRLNNTGYVPYVGASTSLVLGNNNLSITGAGANVGYLDLTRTVNSTVIGTPVGGVRMAGNNNGNLLLTTSLDAFTRIINGTITSNRTYTLPNVSGTLALTNTVTLANVLTNNGQTTGLPIYFTNNANYLVQADSSIPGQLQLLAFNQNTAANTFLNVSTNFLQIQAQDFSFGTTLVTISSNLFLVDGGYSGFNGIQYNGDYSANYIPGSLVDKRYVTGTFIASANRDYGKITECSFIVVPTFGSNQTIFGGEISSFGTLSTPAPNATNFQTQRPRTRFASAAVAASYAGFTSSAANWWNGGGFIVDHEFSVSSDATGMKAFVGLTTNAGNLSNEPTSYTNIFGIGYDTASSATGNWYFISNDNAGGSYTQDLGSNAARNITNVYRVVLTCAPNATAMTLTLYNLSMGVMVISETLITNIPTGLFLYYKMEVGTGALATAAQIENTRLTIRI